ncbi:hypothetical protein HPB51_021103 [Rhipicephalus microplus]|uniref:Uncharacterized protein n=1 Tax=Rhipicephalus microplus TaxID=6941 RepID=A0A9J6E3T3_RHIMP|nr:hypothetical protein HPB51_021103 [Rhipicephalus microplus]
MCLDRGVSAVKVGRVGRGKYEHAAFTIMKGDSTLSLRQRRHSAVTVVIYMHIHAGRYMIPFRHPRVPEQYLMMRDFAFFDKVHKVFTEREEYIHKYMFSQPGALTGAINYYRAFNNDKEQLNKLRVPRAQHTNTYFVGAEGSISHFTRRHL